MTPQLKFVFDRKKRATSDKKGTVELRIIYQRKVQYTSTGVKCLPSQWDSKKSCVKGLNAVELNGILMKIQKKALKIIGDMIDSDRIDISAIPKLLSNQGVDMTFTDYVFKRIQKKKVVENTHKTYMTMYNKLVEYGKIKFFSDVTQKNIRDFSEWLHAYQWESKDRYGNVVKRTYSQASIYKITSNLSLFITDAVIDGYLTENPYVTKRMNESKGGTRINEYLTVDEVKRIEDATMPTNSIREARDLFLLQCYTGLSYADLMTYDYTQIKGTHGMVLCTGKRVKTDVEYAFVVTDKTRELLESYGYKMPKLPNQKYNIKLKLVADAAGIDRNLTSHMGRRTAGSMWLNGGIPIEVVSKCLGHSSVLMTQKAYAKILDTTIMEAFKKNESNEKPVSPSR